MGLVSRDSPVMLEYAQSLILMKKSLIIMHTCFGDDRKTEKERKKERKGKKKSIIYSDKHQLIYHSFVPCCLKKKDSRTLQVEYSI